MKKLNFVLMSVLTVLGVFAAGSDVANSATGAALFSSYCSACHPGNAKQGATAARIDAAIKSNTGGMGSLSTLTAADIQAISAYLGGAVATTTTNTTGTATTTLGSLLGGATTTGTATGATGSTATAGAALYTGNCVSCHGAAGNLSGSSASGISNAISRNKGGMGSLASLTSSQIQTIANYLSAVSCNTVQPATNNIFGNTGSIATYDTSSGNLNILSILAGNSSYTATLTYDGTCASSICFKVRSAAKTNSAPNIFMASKKGDHSNGENNDNNNEDNNNNWNNNNESNNNQGDDNSNNETNNENENEDIRNSCTESSVLDSNSGVINISSVQVGNTNYQVALEYYGACDSSAAAACFKLTAVRQNQ